MFNILYNYIGDIYMKEVVAIGISGGVESSVAAY